MPETRNQLTSILAKSHHALLQESGRDWKPFDRLSTARKQRQLLHRLRRCPELGPQDFPPWFKVRVVNQVGGAEQEPSSNPITPYFFFA